MAGRARGKAVVAGHVAVGADGDEAPHAVVLLHRQQARPVGTGIAEQLFDEDGAVARVIGALDRRPRRVVRPDDSVEDLAVALRCEVLGHPGHVRAEVGRYGRRLAGGVDVRCSLRRFVCTRRRHADEARFATARSARGHDRGDQK
jgi:hypothetical protein